MEPDRRSAPIKIKIHSSDVFNLDQAKQIADSIKNMSGKVVSRDNMKNWSKLLASLFYHVPDFVGLKLVLIGKTTLAKGNILGKFTCKKNISQLISFIPEEFRDWYKVGEIPEPPNLLVDESLTTKPNSSTGEKIQQSLSEILTSLSTIHLLADTPSPSLKKRKRSYSIIKIFNLIFTR